MPKFEVNSTNQKREYRQAPQLIKSITGSGDQFKPDIKFLCQKQTLMGRKSPYLLIGQTYRK